MFSKASKTNRKIRLAISGVSGAGKTYSALAIGTALGKKVAFIDTEKKSASLYDDYFHFDVCNLEQYHPAKYIEAIRFAGEAGYDVLIIDSLSHCWGAMLDIAGGNFKNWSTVAKLETALIDALLTYPGHLIVCMREKSDFVVEEGVNKQGRVTTAPKKVGMKPIMRDGIEYEFDIAGTIDGEHILSLYKSRCNALQDTTWFKPGKELAEQLLLWLSSGNAEVDKAVNEPKERGERQANELNKKVKDLGLGFASVRKLLAEELEGKNPRDLTAEQFDWLMKQLDLIADELDQDEEQKLAATTQPA